MTHTNQPTRFRFSLLGLLIFTSVCAVLAATWPRGLPAITHGFLFVWTAIVLALMVAWWMASTVAANLPADKTDNDREYLSAYRLAKLGVMGPIATWLLAYFLFGVFELKMPPRGIVDAICLLVLFNGISSVSLTISISTCCRFRKKPSLFFMQAFGFILMIAFWLLILLLPGIF